MRLRNPMLMLALCFCLEILAVSAGAQSAASSTQQPGGAYQSGFDHGKADADRKLPSNNQPTDQWATDEERSAYRQGYDAGYSAASSTKTSTSAPSTSEAQGTSQAAGTDPEQFGYQDGLASGRKDHDSGHSFRPTEGDMYKKADHGWTADFGDREHFKQLYRQAYARGYQEGYGNPAPR